MPGPIVVLVHGAFADASGFAGVIRELESSGHTALAPPNPLRGVAFDASVVSAVVKAIDGPVVLVGHSYGGAVIGQASEPMVSRSPGLCRATPVGTLCMLCRGQGLSSRCWASSDERFLRAHDAELVSLRVG